MWYAASLLYESAHDCHPSSDALWEDRIVLVQADSEAAAKKQAESFGKAEECAYTSATGEPVHWVFRQVERIYPIETETLESGTEVFSRFLRASEAESLLTPFREEPIPSASRST